MDMKQKHSFFFMNRKISVINMSHMFHCAYTEMTCIAFFYSKVESNMVGFAQLITFNITAAIS